MSTPMIVPSECSLPGSPLAKARPGIDACVHCGFCLQACPTYVTLDDENDSPRGRIVLMRALLEGTLAPGDETVERHIAQCLGCRACETVCPSGVPYGHLLEATRETLAEHRPIPFVARAILAVFERPTLLAMAMAAGRAARALRLSRLLMRLPGRLGFAMAMLESTRPAPSNSADRSRETSSVRASVALLKGCVMEGLFGPTNRATERVLHANGFATTPVDGQRCCGALHAHAGDADAARRLARANVAAFERADVDYIVVNAAGCGAMMKDYGHLLADDADWAERAKRIAAKVRDWSELLSASGSVAGGAVHARVAYDAPCHLIHAQRIATAPVDLLRAIPGLQVVPLNESEMCCGSAGIYNLVEPETSDVVLERKLHNVELAAPQVLATGNPGCFMQMGAGLLRSRSATRVVHPIDLLDESYGAAKWDRGRQANGAVQSRAFTYEP